MQGVPVETLKEGSNNYSRMSYPGGGQLDLCPYFKQDSLIVKSRYSHLYIICTFDQTFLCSCSCSYILHEILRCEPVLCQFRVNYVLDGWEN